jgi:hypothetical protein
MNLSKNKQRYNLNEKQQINKKYKTKIASEIQNLNEKYYCSQPTGTARLRKPARGLLRVPAWTLGPAAKGWAGEVAQRRTLSGLKLAHAAANAPPPSIARSMAEIEPAWIEAVYKLEMAGKP